MIKDYLHTSTLNIFITNKLTYFYFHSVQGLVLIQYGHSKPEQTTIKLKIMMVGFQKTCK